MSDFNIAVAAGAVGLAAVAMRQLWPESALLWFLLLEISIVVFLYSVLHGNGMLPPIKNPVSTTIILAVALVAAAALYHHFGRATRDAVTPHQQGHLEFARWRVEMRSWRRDDAPTEPGKPFYVANVFIRNTSRHTGEEATARAVRAELSYHDPETGRELVRGPIVGRWGQTRQPHGYQEAQVMPDPVDIPVDAELELNIAVKFVQPHDAKHLAYAFSNLSYANEREWGVIPQYCIQEQEFDVIVRLTAIGLPRVQGRFRLKHNRTGMDIEKIDESGWMV